MPIKRLTGSLGWLPAFLTADTFSGRILTRQFVLGEEMAEGQFVASVAMLPRWMDWSARDLHMKKYRVR